MKSASGRHKPYQLCKPFKNPPCFKVLFTFFLMIFYPSLYATTLEVGQDKTYASPAQAAPHAMPGDTILIFPGIYTNIDIISNMHGQPGSYIYIMGTDAETVIFQGGSQGMHFSQVSYIQISDLSFTLHTGNGLNIDDAGTFDTPSHHIRIINCHFYNMGAQGNNDFLKMSGVDDFEVLFCTFINGADGGSGIDMVGCHNGEIIECRFEDMGSNCIQAKGGTQFITIAQNYFENGGARTLNLGGSTGLEFFRPVDAPFEAADIDVYANVFIGSTAPIAYVGSVRVQVVNNTIINPGNWIVRILQETVDTSRFLPCGDNDFINNIVYYSSSISTHVNIGPDTEPTTFTFSNNLWYRHTDSTNSAPALPVMETDPVIGLNPLFVEFNNNDFRLSENSPAIDAGTSTAFSVDHSGNTVPQGAAPDIGAFEYESVLPVSFLGPFLETGEHSIIVRWKTLTEQNNDYFTVEKSQDGSEWIPIEVVKGNDNTQHVTPYKVYDREPWNGKSLYRIKQTDFNGLYSYSEIAAINYTSHFNLPVSVYPNPFNSFFTVTGLDDKLERMELFDAMGNSIFINNKNCSDGIECIFYTNALPPGIYYLKGETFVKKLIKHD